MEPASANFAELRANSKRLVKRLFAIGENRLELLLVEVQEERNQLLHALLLVLGVAAFGFLAGVALTVVIVVLLWNVSPIGALVALAGLYAASAAFLYRRLVVLKRNWKTLPATLSQIRKDRECLEKNLT
jgi:uncharacterized membrane protein YqjE